MWSKEGIMKIMPRSKLNKLLMTHNIIIYIITIDVNPKEIFPAAELLDFSFIIDTGSSTTILSTSSF